LKTSFISFLASLQKNIFAIIRHISFFKNTFKAVNQKNIDKDLKIKINMKKKYLKYFTITK